jgi:hypothetical protein
LKLPTVTAECEKVAGCRARENAHHLGFLLKLSELALLERERRAPARPLMAARFPTAKTLDRLAHCCTVVETGRESYRLREARSRRRRGGEPTAVGHRRWADHGVT